MPVWADLFGTVTAVEVIAWLVAAALLVLIIRKTWPWFRKAVRLVDALAELPDFMERTDQRIKEIHHEVHYNDETSVKDAVSRVELGVKGLYERAEDAAAAAEKVRQDLEQKDQKWT